MSGLSPREQRLVAVFILLLLLGAAWQFIVAPVIDGFAARSTERDRLVATIQHNDRLIATLPQLRRRVERQRPDRARFALAAANREMAADLLRQRLQHSFEVAGASISGLGDSEASGRWVAASAEGALTLDQLVRLLTELQDQTPYLVITGLNVIADRAFQTGKLDLMTVKIDVAIPYSRTA